MLVTFLEMWGSTGAGSWDVTEKIGGTSGHKWSNMPVNFSFNFVEQSLNQAFSLGRETVLETQTQLFVCISQPLRLA